jgi:hypothetical protein
VQTHPDRLRLGRAHVEVDAERGPSNLALLAELHRQGCTPQRERRAHQALVANVQGAA